MKKAFSLVCLCILALSFQVSGQKFSVGLMSGLNHSNIHGDNTSGKWQSKTGPVAGVQFNYSFNRFIGVGTEFNYTSLYYQHLSYETVNQPWYPELHYLSSSCVMPVKNNLEKHYDFSFYRFPLYLTFSTPTFVRFDLSLGCYYALMDNYNVSESYPLEKPPKEDFGYMLSVGWSLPVTPKVELFMKGRYVSGRKEYISMNKGKNGSAEWLLGVSYSGLLNKLGEDLTEASRYDSSQYRFSMTYKLGYTYSWLKANQHQSAYSGKSGFVGGIAFNYRLNDYFAVESGLLYMQKGYQLSDNSPAYFRSVDQDNDHVSHQTDTETQLNYLNIPLMMNIGIGKKLRVTFSGGCYMGFRLNASTTGTSIMEYRYNQGYSLKEIKVNDNIEGNIAPRDWGWIGGTTVQIPVYRQWVFDVACTYQHGMMNILELQDGSQSNGTTSFKNRTIAVSLGLHIPIR